MKSRPSSDEERGSTPLWCRSPKQVIDISNWVTVRPTSPVPTTRRRTRCSVAYSVGIYPDQPQNTVYAKMLPVGPSRRLSPPEISHDNADITTTNVKILILQLIQVCSPPHYTTCGGLHLIHAVCLPNALENASVILYTAILIRTTLYNHDQGHASTIVKFMKSAFKPM
jgi:hypothetical protein